MGAKKYVRIRFIPAGARRTRTAWAMVLGPQKYLIVTREGDESRVVNGVETIEIVRTAAVDVTYVEPAHMSLKYGELEVSP